MKPLNADEVEAYLRRYGFVRGHGGKGSHAGWFHPETGRTTTVPHHGSKKLSQGTLNVIFNQAGIPKPQR